MKTTFNKKLKPQAKLVVLSEDQYNQFLHWQGEKELAEEQDTDEAIRVHRKEKKSGKLKVLRSLVDLD